MRIAYLTNLHSSSPISGGFVHVSQVASHLQSRGHILYTNLLDESDSFITLTNEQFYHRGKEIEAFYVRIHGHPDNDLLTLFRKANSKAPCIWEINAPLEELRTRAISEGELSSLNRKRKSLARTVDAAICVSDEMEEYAKEQLYIKHTRVVPNGSDPELFSPSKKDPSIFDESRFIVFWAGSQQFKWQGIRIVNDVAEKMREVDDSILFVATGEGTVTSNMRFVGNIPYKEMAMYIASADIGLCVYEKIDFFKNFFFSPLKLYDYMACGIPVIGSDVGQIKQVIEEYQNGLTVGDSIEDIIEKIIFLKENKETMKQMGANGRKAVESYFNWARVAGDIEQAIHDAIESKAKRFWWFARNY